MNNRKLIERLSEGLPTFSDGRIDYTHATVAPVLNCAVYAEGQVLILRRGQNVLAYPGKWNGVSGFIDCYLPIKELAQNELSEEIKLIVAPHQITVLEHHEYNDEEIGRQWVVFPVKVALAAKPKIHLDSEHTRHQWITPSQLEEYDILPDFKKVIKRTITV